MEGRITAIEKSIDERKLLIAAGSGDLEEVKCLLSKKVDVNFPDEGGYTPLHYAVESGKFDVVQQLLKEKEVDVIVESNDNRSPLDIARRIENQDIIDLVVERIIDNTFEVLEDSSNIDKPDRPSSDTGLEKGAEKIKQTEDKIESCLEFLKTINADVPGAEPNGISYDQANILIYFIETFALDGAGNTMKNQLKIYFSQYYTEQDRQVFSNARTLLLHISADKKIRLEDIATFINGDIKSFFTKLEEYVQYVQDVKKLKDSLKTTASKLRGQGTGEHDVPTSFKEEFDKFMEQLQIEGKLTQAEVKEFREQFYHKVYESSDEVVKSFFIELQKSVQKNRQEEFFFKTSNDKIGEEMSVGSYLEKEFETLMHTSYTEENITQELLFNFVVNIYPAFDHITSDGTEADLEKFRDLRNNLIHEFHKFGAIEFKKEISKLRHTLFKYYFAQRVNQALWNIKSDEDPEVIDGNLKQILVDFKDRYKNVMEKEYVISSEEAKDFFGYKFSKMLFPESGDHSERLVDEYLKFMVIIDCAKDSPIDEEQDENPRSRKELNASSRREIFEEFCRLRRIREHSHGNCNYYDAEKLKFEGKLFHEYGVPKHHFREICKLYVENQSSRFVDSTESKEISDIIKSLKKIKDVEKLSNRFVISEYNQCLNKKKTFGSDEHKRLLEKNGVDNPEGLIDKLKALPSEKNVNISIGKDLLSIRRGEVISNMLNTFYNAYNVYTIQLDIEEIFNDRTFLDYLVAKETEVTTPKVEDFVDRYLKLTIMFNEHRQNMDEGSPCKEINGDDRKRIFEEFDGLKEIYKHSQNKIDRNYYEKEKQEFRELVFSYGIEQQGFDNLCKCCIEEDYDLTDEEDGVHEVKKMINDLKSILVEYKLSNKMIASLFKEAMKGRVRPKQVRRVIQQTGKVAENIADILNNLPNPDNNEVSVQLGREKWSINIRKVTCDMLEAFVEKPIVKLKPHNDMIIETLLKVADYTAPYIVRLITKVESDANIREDDLVKLVKILLTKKERVYIESLNELLNLRSRKLSLYEEVRNKIVEPSFDIYSMRLTFEENQHVEGILTVLIDRIRSEDEPYVNMIELSKRVIEILVHDIFAFGFSEYEEEIAIFKQLLELIQVIKPTPIDPDDPIVAFEYDIKLKIAKVINYQLGELDKNQSPDLAIQKCKEALGILEHIPDNVHPQSLLALHHKACTLNLQKYHKEAYETRCSLYEKIVKDVCNLNGSDAELHTKETYTKIEGSEKYKELLAKSLEYNKHLNILRISNCMARDLLSVGTLNNKVELCEKALGIYKEVYSYQKGNSVLKQQSYTASTGSYIARAHHLTAKVLSKQKKYQDALKHTEYALLRNVRFAKIRKDMYGNYHPAINRAMSHIVNNLGQIASLREKLGDVRSTGNKNKTFYQEALTLSNKIHGYRKRYLGESHGSTLKTKGAAESVNTKLVRLSSPLLNWRTDDRLIQ